MAVQGIEAIKVLSEDQKDTIINSVDKFRREWTEIIALLDDIDAIRELAFRGELKVSKFRSIYWAILLRVLSTDHKTWIEQRKQQRNRYEKLKQEFVKNPHIEIALNDDPLSQSKQSIWNQYFSDQELFAVIKQDVIRTFPGVEFFRKPVIQTSMINILFYYAREHPYMCYRQGMHEILAPILFVMYGDHQALLHFRELTPNIDELLMDVLNPEYLEADSYSLFSRLMASIESYYRVTNLVQSENGYFKIQNDQNLIDPVTTEVEVIGQLNLIRDKILAKEDLHLHNYLLKLDIPLHIFGIRWLRLLFGREFPLLDLLMLWDAIFADGDRFDLPNYILVAMLIRIRDKLLLNDYTTCLTYLMRYPSNVDINLILRHALHMQTPKKYDRPANAFVYFTMNNENPAQSVSLLSSQKSLSTTALPKISKTFPNRTITQQRPEEPVEKRPIAPSVSSDMKFHKQITDIQYKNALDSAAIARLKATPESDKVIVDGYSENSPELLRMELKNAQTIINISRFKLQNYLEAIKKNTKNPTDELSHALDGIEELCSFLDVKFIFPFNSRSHTIDQALEADENRQLKSMPTSSGERTMNGMPTTTNGQTQVKGTQVEEDDDDDDDEDDDDDDDDNTINLSIIVNNATAYEKPDTGYMLDTIRLLGNRKEVELIPIITDERIAGEQQRTKPFGVPSTDPLGFRDD